MKESLQYCYLLKNPEYFLHHYQQYLSLPEQTSDLHPVQVPAWVDSTVVMADTDLLNYIPHICQLQSSRKHHQINDTLRNTLMVSRV